MRLPDDAVQRELESVRQEQDKPHETTYEESDRQLDKARRRLIKHGVVIGTVKRWGVG